MLKKPSIKPLARQTAEEKVYILKLIAHQKLGSKWVYFRKIKHSDSGLKIFKEQNILEQMKATKAALRFTTKNARKLYRSVYQDCLKEIKAYTGLKEDFPELLESDDGEELQSLTSVHDAEIISWTPIKFMIPVAQLRSKGLATQRHTEGLSAKLIFKVAGFYAAPENWDRDKLNLYLRRIRKDSSYQEIVTELEPLKKDLERFVEAYEPFKFGQASLSRDISADIDTYDDAMGVESFETQLGTLYWYQFIYHAIELFIFKYYLTLITSTVSKSAIRYLTTLFEPVFSKVIEVRNVFLGSFETDRSKRAFRRPYHELVDLKKNESGKKNIKTNRGVFETYTYNLSMLEQKDLNFELEKVPVKDSDWWNFMKQYILDIDRPSILDGLHGRTKVEPAETVQEKSAAVAEEQAPDDMDQKERDRQRALEREFERRYTDRDKLDETEQALRSEDLRKFVLMNIMSTIVTCIQLKRQARYKILERFKERVQTDRELEAKRIEEIQKKAEKKLRELKRKKGKIDRLKQSETASMMNADIERFEKGVQERIEIIQNDSRTELQAQKERLNELFTSISKEKSLELGLTCRYLLELIKNIDPKGSFYRDFLAYVSFNVQKEYARELEPLYKNIFSVFDLQLSDKILMIQSLQQTGGDKVIQLKLTPEEEQKYEEMIAARKADLEKKAPDLFSCKVIFLAKLIPMNDLFRLSIDNKSLGSLLMLKIASPKSTQKFNLSGEVIRGLLEINRLINPVPKNTILQEGKEADKNPEKRINSARLSSILDKLN